MTPNCGGMLRAGLIGLLLAGVSPDVPAAPPVRLVPPVEEGGWLRPADAADAEPVWGFKDGLQIGLPPTPGPRGLLRVYAPTLGADRPRVINFISVEPVVRGDRGQSELEGSARDGLRGKALASGDTAEEALRFPDRPARGRLVRPGGREALTVFVAVEPFRNGARPVLQLVFRRDRPHEVALRTLTAPGSLPMDSCVLSATMGNYARLRRLWLAGEVVDARRLWPRFTPDRLGFAPWRQWPVGRLLARDGEAVVAATPDETDPAATEYDPAVAAHWRYRGRPATQVWRAAAVPELVARVNGRATYWMSRAPIPGGTAYENFELEVPFRAGQEFRFAVTADPPERLGFDPAWGRRITDGR